MSAEVKKYSTVNATVMKSAIGFNHLFSFSVESHQAGVEKRNDIFRRHRSQETRDEIAEEEDDSLPDLPCPTPPETQYTDKAPNSSDAETKDTYKAPSTSDADKGSQRRGEVSAQTEEREKIEETARLRSSHLSRTNSRDSEMSNTSSKGTASSKGSKGKVARQGRKPKSKSKRSAYCPETEPVSPPSHRSESPEKRVQHGVIRGGALQAALKMAQARRQSNTEEKRPTSTSAPTQSGPREKPITSTSLPTQSGPREKPIPISMHIGDDDLVTVVSSVLTSLLYSDGVSRETVS